jgi:hypothetical protein
VTVKVANAAGHDEVVEDAAALDRLVSLHVESLGAAPAPAASRAVPRRFPFVLHAGRTATLRYRVPVDAANDPAESSQGSSDHDDFRVVVALDPASLDPRPRSPLLSPAPAGSEGTSIDVVVR